MITYREFFAASKRMRAAQREYYRAGRKREDLIVARVAEDALDKLIAQIESRRPLEEGGGTQGVMFGGEQGGAR